MSHDAAVSCVSECERVSYVVYICNNEILVLFCRSDSDILASRGNIVCHIVRIYVCMLLINSYGIEFHETDTAALPQMSY